MIENLQKGALPDKVDGRDFKAEMVMGLPPQINWGVEFRQPEPTDTDQGNSDACVGHAWSYYQQQLRNERYSVRSVFAYIAQAYGAEIRDGGLRIIKNGQETYAEAPDPSLETPQNMRDRTGLRDDLAVDGKELNSFVLPNQQIDYLAAAIKDYKGFVFGVVGSNPGWQNLEVPNYPQPGETTWGHALYAFGYHTHSDGQKCIIAKSSWCNYVKEHHIRANYFASGNCFNAWTLIPKGKTMELIKDKGTVYLVAGVNQKVKTGLSDQAVEAGLFGDEPVTDGDTSAIPQTYTISDTGFIINKK